jgi:GT2 family glycosyltransferase
MKPLVWIIIVNWNSETDTIECLKSIFRIDYENYRVMVVDNGSTPKSVEGIKKEFPEIVIIKNKENTGYTGGNNIGIEYALINFAEYILLLNADTVVEKSFLSILVEFGESEKEVALLSPKIYYYEMPLICQWTASRINLKKLIFSDLSKNIESNISGKDICLWGTSLLIKAKVIKQIGTLNERFFAYWEDTEYSIRAIKAGYRNSVVGKAKVYHKHQLPKENGNPKSGYYYYYYSRNKFLLGEMHIQSKFNHFQYRIKCIGKFAEFIKRCTQENMQFCINGVWHGLIGIDGMMKFEKQAPVLFNQALLTLSKWHPEFIADFICLDFRNIIAKIKKLRKKKRYNQ